MKKISIKAVSVILTLLMVFGVLCVVPVSVGAEGTGISSLSVTPADTESSSDIKGINWYYYSKDNSYYIFSPQTYDKSALRLWFDASDTVTCGGAELVSGEVTDIFASGQATLNCGENSYVVKVLDGGDVGSVQITTESGTLDNVHADKSYKEPGNILVSGGDGTVMYDMDLTGPIGLVIGNEGEGVSQLVKKNCDMVASIPMKGDIDSLNASVATGVLAYEILRQRMKKG